jgi:hypothetical protein
MRELDMPKFEFNKFFAPKPEVAVIVGGHPATTSYEATMVRTTDAPDYIDYGSGYLPGKSRTFGNHGVCLRCGAMVDAEFLDTHSRYHGSNG